ncbi:hypothetical protein [Ferrimicrobium acidiphilum]|uniref:hypothetical protein n=1 Tax=Ferrimicrobium acidiphilum TaxID=121039 RepID=UPI0023EF706D|nr:hypothetical protein [Ferrimicrobium acidiphilum]
MADDRASEEFVPIRAVEAMFGMGSGGVEDVLRYQAVPVLGFPIPLPGDAFQVLSRCLRSGDLEEHVTITCLSHYSAAQLVSMYSEVLTREGMQQIHPKLPMAIQPRALNGSVVLHFGSRDLGRGWFINVSPEGDVTRSLVRTMPKHMLEMEASGPRRFQASIELPQFTALVRSPDVVAFHGGGSGGSESESYERISVESKAGLATMVALIEQSLHDADIHVDEVEVGEHTAVVFWSQPDQSLLGSVSLFLDDRIDDANRFYINTEGVKRRQGQSSHHQIGWTLIPPNRPS